MLHIVCSAMVTPDSSGSQRKTKNKCKAINEKIKTFNDNRCCHMNLINRHAMEIFWHLINSDRIELSNDTLEKIQLKLAGTIEFLHKQQRHIALYAIIQSKKYCTAVLTALIPTVNADFYQTPNYVMRLIANEIEMQHKNRQDISPVINAIKTHNRKEASNIWWENLESLPDCCQELLRDAPWQ
ncbi:hypothetical protein SC171_27775 [Pantoea cypripedii]|uniref:hypothetical protein n=1 Tax=Pantoea cypripedii TaxID=55209 RepID=UPI002FC589EA